MAYSAPKSSYIWNGTFVTTAVIISLIVLEVTVNCKPLKFSPARPRHNHCHTWESRKSVLVLSDHWPHLPIIEWSCEVDLWRAFENDCSGPWMKALGPGSSRTRAVWVTSLEYCCRGPKKGQLFNFQFGSYNIYIFFLYIREWCKSVGISHGNSSVTKQDVRDLPNIKTTLVI